MEKDRFKQGDMVRHFKWETLTEEEKESKRYMYLIIGVAIHSETRESFMVYKALYDDEELFIRPLDMFLSEVEHDKYPYIKQKYRFVVV